MSNSLSLTNRRSLRHTFGVLSDTVKMPNLIATGGALVLMWFVLPRTANSSAGIGVVFATTGLLGLGLGPLLSMYLSLPNGPQIVATALGGTGAIFLGLNGPVVKSHGGTDYIGFSNSLNVCNRIIKGNLIDKIKYNLEI